MGESLQQERESPWALTLTDPVPEAFEFSPSDWPEKYFSGQSAKRNSRATLMSSYTKLFSSSIAVVAWPVIVYSVANYRPHVSHFWANIPQIPTCQNLLTPEILQMCDPILATLLAPIENTTPL